jgi:hypothetical protein
MSKLLDHFLEPEEHRRGLPSMTKTRGKKSLSCSA